MPPRGKNSPKIHNHPFARNPIPAAHGRDARRTAVRTLALLVVSVACMGQSCATPGEMIEPSEQVLGYRPPAPLIADAGLDLTVKPGSAVLLNGAIVDNQTGTTPSVQWVQTAGPDGKLIGSFRLKPSFVAPTVEDGSTLTFSLTLSVGAITASDEVNVVISRQANRALGGEDLPLYADAGADQFAVGGAEVTLDASRSAGSSGEITSTGWQQIAGPVAVMRGANTTRPVFTAPRVQTDTVLSFSVTVRDATGSATDETSVTVLATPLSEADIAVKATPSRGSTPLNVVFAAHTLALGNEQTYFWDFGDGTTGEGAQVSHLYANTGSYLASACLAVSAGVSPVCVYTSVAAGETNSIPIATPMSLIVSTAAAVIQLSGTDQDQDALTFQVHQLPVSGTLLDQPDGRAITALELPYSIAPGGNTVTYMPADGFVGTDTFRFAASDGRITGPAAAVMITVPTGATPASYQNTIPPLTEDRFINVQNAPEPGTVTRNDYMQFIQKWYNNQRPHAWSVMGKSDAAYQHDYARREAFFYRITRDASYAGRAIEFMRGSHAYHRDGPGRTGVDWDIIVAAGQACVWVFDAASPADRAFMQEYLLLLESRLRTPPEYGAMNRSIGSALGRKIIATLFPNAPGAAERNAYCEQVWNDWWQYRDTDENASSYNASFWRFAMIWLEITGQENAFQDERFRKTAERYLAQVTPLGFVPAYGDTVGLNSSPGAWVAIFEKWASGFNDGRFRWAAHRLFEWSAARERDMNQWGNLTIWMMDHLIDARLWANDNIAAQKPEIPSQITTRKAMRWLSAQEKAASGYYARLLDQDIPDKLILRNGWNPDSYYAMVELAPHMGHGHGDTGSINAFIADGSVLLADTPYLVKNHEYHNAFLLTQGEKPTFNGPSLTRMRTTARLSDHALAACAHVHIDEYMGQPAALDRRIVFLKNTPLLWVQDTLSVTQELTASVGPAWQTLRIYPERGTQWLDNCLPTVPLAYIWDLKYLMQWSNVERDLLTLFLPHPGASLKLDDVTRDESKAIVAQTLQNNFTQRIWWREADKRLLPGTLSRFSTILVAHRPTPDYAQLPSHFSMALDAPDAAVVEFRPTGSRTVWMGLNETGRMLDLARFRTDARQFVIDLDANRPARYVIIDATQLTLDGQPEHASPDRQTREK